MLYSLVLDEGVYAQLLEVDEAALLAELAHADRRLDSGGGSITHSHVALLTTTALALELDLNFGIHGGHHRQKRLVIFLLRMVALLLNRDALIDVDHIV